MTNNLKGDTTMKQFKFKSIIALMAISLFVAGCSGESKATTITIKPEGNNMAFETKRFEVKAGQEVTIIMDNVATLGVMKHNVVILSNKSAINEVGQAAITAPGNVPDHSAIIAATPMAGPGERTQITFKAPKTPGEYVYICTFPGHYIAMQGVMVVK